MSRYFRQPFLIACAIISIAVSLVHPAPAARAVSGYPDWQAGMPVVRQRPGVVTVGEAPAIKTCDERVVSVTGHGSGTACVTEMDGWRYALYSDTYSLYGMTLPRTQFVIGLGSDTQMYAVIGMPHDRTALPAVGTDTLVYQAADGAAELYADLPRHLVKTGDAYDVDAPPHALIGSDGQRAVFGAMAVSGGGEWLVADSAAGITRVNLRSLAGRVVAPALAAPNGYRPRAALAVSDDGGTVAVGGQLYDNRHFDIITVTDGCSGGSGTDRRPCASQDMRPLFDDGSLPDGWPVSLSFSASGHRLDFADEGYDGRTTQWSAYPYGDVPPRLGYLALGDSFSSGEGDTGRTADGRTLYLPHTDDVATGETCHVSPRAYPFVLAGYAGLTDRVFNLGVRSVACSNAQIRDIADVTGREGGYSGQSGRLAGVPAAGLADLRAAALAGFVPGRLRQEDFADEYQPAAMSLSIGGNDVQFSQIINACVFSLTTCNYARDPGDRRNLGESIGALYPKLTALYGRLARSDPGARIYAVGYPRFVNPDAATCPATVGLDMAERRMIDEGVLYIDAVIKAAARQAGVAYVDVTDALAGHRMCDDPGDYVNAISLLGGQQLAETFHPNAAGHTALALAIERDLGTADVAATDYCLSAAYPCPQATGPPALPAYFGDASDRPLFVAVPTELVRVANAALPPALVRGGEVVVQAALLAAGSTVTMELHSQPATIAAGSVGTDGSVTLRGSIPADAAVGYHTLHLYATSPSGEKLDMYQIVYVGDGADATPAPVAASPEPQATPLTPATGDGRQEGVPAGCPAECQPPRTPVSVVVEGLPATFGRSVGLWLPGALVLVAAGPVLAGRVLWRRGRR